MKSRFTEEQIIKILKEHEHGKKAAEIVRENNISEQTFYRWKSKYGGMEINEAKRLKQLEEENRRLKEMVAELSLDNRILKDIKFKKLLKPATKRRIAAEIQEDYAISERHACRLAGISQNSKRYQPVDKSEDKQITERLVALSARWKRFGYRRLHVMLQREGIKINHKRTYRLYKEAGLSLPKRSKKKKYEKRGMPQRANTEPNTRWAMDFVSDRTRNGLNIRVLTVIDEVTRECLALEVDSSLTGRRVTAVLNRIALFRGLPKEILTDNGSEFTSNIMNVWAYDHKVEHIFTDPGKPMQNGYIESFNGKLRAECLNQHWFGNIPEAKDLIENWRLEYNQVRPHSSLDNLTPEEYALKLSCNY
ncbi:MAG TPA: IS3 family transposase [Clostridiales bacterium]|nr:IS3 family transposase [Clostridiales bacterium]